MYFRLFDLNLDTLQLPYTFKQNKPPYAVISYVAIDIACWGFTGLHETSFTIKSKQGDRLKGEFSGIKICPDSITGSRVIDITEGEFDIKLNRKP
jgi:hypothetical protein